MARTIGRTKSWLWWILGAVCALILGAGASQGAEKTLKYGVMPRPVPPEHNLPQPKYGGMPRPIPVEELQRQEAEKLVAQYEALKPNEDEESVKKLAETVKKLKALGAIGQDAVTAKIKEQVKAWGEARKSLVVATEAGDADAAAKAEADVKATRAKWMVLVGLIRTIAPPPADQPKYGVAPPECDEPAKPVPPPDEPRKPKPPSDQPQALYGVRPRP